MANQAKAGSNSFLDNLGKIYLMYTGGFFGFVAILAVLEQLGVPNKWIGYGFVFLTIAVYALIGVLSRTSEVGEYYVRVYSRGRSRRRATRRSSVRDVCRSGSRHWRCFRTGRLLPA